MDQIKDDQEIMKYFPDAEDLNMEINRKYAHTIFATLKSALAKKLIEDAQDKRFKKSLKIDADPGIPEDMLELLDKFAFKSVSA